MISSRLARQIIFTSYVVIASLWATLWYALKRGQDVNWDQQNYHIGIPWLLAHHQFWSSVNPAGVQSYFNPFLLQIQYFGITHFSATHFVVLLAIAQSITFMTAGIICGAICQPSTGWKELSVSSLGFLLCIIAAVPLSEAGTTFIDLLTGAPVILAYAILLTRGRMLLPTWSVVTAGILLGVAAGLKLTAGVFALAAFGFFIFGAEKIKQRAYLFCTFYLSIAAAFFVINGRWMMALFSRFGNPLFPWYNAIFRSPDFVNFNSYDGSVFFKLHSDFAIWSYPAFWLFGDKKAIGWMPSLQVPFRDARWFPVIILSTVFILALATFPAWRKRQMRIQTNGFWAALLIAYLLWLFIFDDHRYFIAADIMCGAGLLFFITMAHQYFVRLVLALGLLIVSWSVMVVPNWGHLPWKPYWQTINQTTVSLPSRPIIFLPDVPTLYVATGLPTDSVIVGLNKAFDERAGSKTYFSKQLTHLLASSPNAPLKEIDLGSQSPFAAAVLKSYGLSLSKRCVPLTGEITKFRMCDITNGSPNEVH